LSQRLPEPRRARRSAQVARPQLGQRDRPEGGFTVSYSLARHRPTTVPAQVIRTPGDLLTSATTKIEPNPVVAELQPITPPKANKPMRPKPKKPKNTAAAPAAAGSAFPDPGQGVPPPPGSSTG